MRIILALMLGLLVSQTSYAADPTKQALVIGNSSYERVQRLANPTNDARAIADELNQLGFDTELDLDTNLQHFRQALVRLRQSMRQARTVIFYYAGHGVSINGQNYLLPIDAYLSKPEDVQERLISLNQLISDFAADQSGHATLIMLDACRNNPFEAQPETRGISFTRGLSEVSINASSLGKQQGSTSFATGTLIAFATGPGSVSRDDVAGTAHSPFANALLQSLPLQLEVNSVFNKVRASVIAATHGQQLPWSQSAMIGDLYLAGMPAPNVSPVAPRIGRQPPP